MFQNIPGFTIAMAMAKELPKKDAMMYAFIGGMFPKNNIAGTVLLKPLIDAMSESETNNASLQTKLDAALNELKNRKLPFGIKLPDPGGNEYIVGLSVPNAKTDNWKIKEVPAPDDISWVGRPGELKIGANATGPATISVDVDGFTREIVVTVV